MTTSFPPEKFLVTGGAGFIGSHSVELLLEQGKRVVVIDNLSSGRLSNLPQHPNLEILVADIRDPSALNEAMSGVSHVLHLAAQVSVQASIDDPLNSCDNNIKGFISVLEAARRAKVGRFVFASSAAVYGIPAELPLHEYSSLCPISPYGLEKQVNEQYAALYSRQFGLSCLGLRYFNIYGPRQDPHSQYAGVISKFIECAQNRAVLRVFGDGLQTRDFMFAKDIAMVNAMALSSQLSGVCNVGTGQSTTLLQLIEVLRNVTGKKFEVVFELARDGDILSSEADVALLIRELHFHKAVDLASGLAALLKFIN